MFDWREERTVCVDRGQLLWYCPVLTVYSLETPGKQKVLEESEMNGKRERAQSQGMSCPTRASSEVDQKLRISKDNYWLFFLILVDKQYRLVFVCAVSSIKLPNK